MIGQRFTDARSAVEHLERRIVETRNNEPHRQFIEDRNLIHNRRRNEPIIPCLPGHNQEEWFAKLESNGIWELVFEYVTDPSDVTSAYFTCDLFRSHLEEKRKMMMLQKVFGVLRDTDRLKYSGFRTDAEAEQSRDILALRHVSKGWKKGVDQEFLLHYDFSEPTRVLENWKYWENRNVTCRFRNVKDVDFAMKKLRDTSTSSYSLLRLVNVVDEGYTCSHQASFYPKLAEFFDLHGEAVWALQFGQRQRQGPGDFKYESLCMLVSKLPNLKALHFHTMGSHFGLDNTEEERRLVLEANERLRLSMLRNPFPCPPSLESLGLYSFPSQNALLAAEIIGRSVNLKAVRLGYLGLLDESPIPQFLWERLRNLRLEYFNVAYCIFNNPTYIQDFLQLRDFDWPLKYLYFGILYGGRLREIAASDIMEVLGRFNDSLKEIVLTVAPGKLRLLNDRRNVVIDLPHLEKISLPPVVNDED